MAPPLEYNFSFRKVFLLLSLALFFFFSSSVLLISASSSSSSSSHSELQRTSPHFIAKSRRLLEAAVGTEEDGEEEKPPPKKKTNTNISPPNKKTNQTKLIKPKTSNSTKSATPTSNLTKTQFKNPKNSTSNSTKTSSSSPPSISTKTLIKKLNSTSKSSNSTKPSSKSSDLLKLSSPTKTIESKNTDNKKPKSSIQQKTSTKPTKKPTFLDQQEDEEDEDLITEFRDLPSRFQDTVLPDWFKISKTSKLYLKKANNDLTKGFKPYVGNKYAPTIATLISCTFLLLPLFLVSLIFHHFKSYFSLQKILIFIQVYLSIYFSILSLSSLVTGLEPLKFFYSTSQSTYVWLQVLQTLGYVLYLLLLLMYLILVFSTDCGLGEKLLGLGQTFVGFAVGLHYYVSVFHRVVLHQPPKTNWKVHGIYATCFLVICLFARAERRKKAYLEEGGEEGKKN